MDLSKSNQYLKDPWLSLKENDIDRLWKRVYDNHELYSKFAQVICLMRDLHKISNIWNLLGETTNKELKYTTDRIRSSQDGIDPQSWNHRLMFKYLVVLTPRRSKSDHFIHANIATHLNEKPYEITSKLIDHWLNFFSINLHSSRRSTELLNFKEPMILIDRFPIKDEFPDISLEWQEYKEFTSEEQEEIRSLPDFKYLNISLLDIENSLFLKDFKINGECQFEDNIRQVLKKGLSVRAAAKIPHEMIGTFYGDEGTDIELSTAFSTLKAKHKKLTPDIIQFKKNQCDIIELTTCKNGNDNKMRESFDNKKLKYESHLAEIEKEWKSSQPNYKFNFGIVVVSDRTLYSNISYNTIQRSKLCYLYKLGWYIRQIISEKFPELKHSQIFLDEGGEKKLAHLEDIIKRHEMSTPPVLQVESLVVNESKMNSTSKPVSIRKIHELIDFPLEARERVRSKIKNVPQSRPKTIYEKNVNDEFGSWMKSEKTSLVRFNGFYGGEDFTKMPKFDTSLLDLKFKTIVEVFKKGFSDSSLMERINFELKNESMKDLNKRLSRNLTYIGKIDPFLSSDEFLDIPKSVAGMKMRLNMNMKREMVRSRKELGIKQDHEKSGYVKSKRFQFLKKLNQEEKSALHFKPKSKTMKSKIEKLLNRAGLMDENSSKVKKALDWDEDLNDIENFISSKDHFDHVDFFPTLVLEEASEDTLFCPYWKEEDRAFISSIRNKKIFNWANFQTKIFRTILKSINHLSPNDKFLLKKIEGGQGYILFRNPTLKGQVFYSVIMKNPQEFWTDGNLFSKFVKLKDEGDTYVFSNWLSVQTADLEMFSCSLETLLNLYVTMEEVFESKEEGEQVFLLASLIFMEGKSRTCSDYLLMRYFYFELWKTDETKYRNPFKILKKMNERCYSRLQLFLWRRLDYIWKKNKDNKSVNFDDNEESQQKEIGNIENQILEDDSVSELYSTKPMNFITKTYCKSSQESLLLSYLGVLKNKRDVEKLSDGKKMVKKLLKEESKLRDNIDFDFWAEGKWPDYGNHSFSPTLLSYGSDLLSRKIFKSMGQSKDQFFKNVILPRLLDITFEDVATFKSTTDVDTIDDEALEIFHEVIQGSGSTEEIIKKLRDNRMINKNATTLNIKIVKRTKLFSKLIDEVGKNEIKESNIFLEIDKILEKIERFTVSLFKKDQWGSLREIFVMSWRDRISALFIETISRCLCEAESGEMLTKGAQKQVPVKLHKEKVSAMINKYKLIILQKYLKKTGRKIVSDLNKVQKQKLTERLKRVKVSSFSDAADRTTWCQQFIMATFATMLSNLVPSWTFKMISDILNKHSGKKIAMPTSILSQFLLTPNVSDPEPSLNLLKENFLRGPCEDGFSLTFGKGSPWIRNESNMMQGVLHFTSSLIHASYYSLCEQILMTKMKDQAGVLPIFTFRFSSDDSAHELTFIHDSKSFNACDFYENFLVDCLVLLPAFNIKDSEDKSTHMITRKVGEFNSEFVFGSTPIYPLLPHVMACSLIPSEIDPSARANEQLNARASLMEKGGNGKLNIMINYTQSRIHYACIFGADESTNMYAWSLIKSLKLDTLGFFLPDHPLIGPLLGQSFNRYLSCSYDINTLINMNLFHHQGTIDSNPESLLESTFKWKISKSYESVQKNSDDAHPKLFSSLGQSQFKLWTTATGLEVKIEKPIIGHRVIQYNYMSEEGDPLTEKILLEPLLDGSCTLRKSKNINEALCKCFLKLEDNALKRSLSFSTSSENFRISTFFLTNNCVKFKSNPTLKLFLSDSDISDLTTGSKSFLQYLLGVRSLMEAMKEKYENEDNFDFLKNLSHPSMKILASNYGEILQIVRSFDDRNKVIIAKRRKMIKMKMNMSKLSEHFNFNVMTTLRAIWYGEYSWDSDVTTKKNWEKLRVSLPWLKDDPIETLKGENCPFYSELAILNYIKRWTSIGSRTISPLGPYRSGVDFKTKLISVCRNYYCWDYYFSEGNSKTSVYGKIYQEWKTMYHFPKAYKLFLDSKMKVLGSLSFENIDNFIEQFPRLNFEDKLCILEYIYSSSWTSLDFMEMMDNTNLIFSGNKDNQSIFVMFGHNHCRLTIKDKFYFLFEYRGKLNSSHTNFLNIVHKSNPKRFKMKEHYMKENEQYYDFNMSQVFTKGKSSRSVGIPMKRQENPVIDSMTYSFDIKCSQKRDKLSIFLEAKPPSIHMIKEQKYRIDSITLKCEIFSIYDNLVDNRYLITPKYIDVPIYDHPSLNCLSRETLRNLLWNLYVNDKLFRLRPKEACRSIPNNLLRTIKFILGSQLENIDYYLYLRKLIIDFKLFLCEKFGVDHNRILNEYNLKDEEDEGKNAGSLAEEEEEEFEGDEEENYAAIMDDLDIDDFSDDDQIENIGEESWADIVDDDVEMDGVGDLDDELMDLWDSMMNSKAEDQEYIDFRVNVFKHNPYFSYNFYNNAEDIAKDFKQLIFDNPDLRDVSRSTDFAETINDDVFKILNNRIYASKIRNSNVISIL